MYYYNISLGHLHYQDMIEYMMVCTCTRPVYVLYMYMCIQSINGWMDGSMDRWIDGSMEEWNGRMDGWING